MVFPADKVFIFDSASTICLNPDFANEIYQISDSQKRAFSKRVS